MDLGRWLFSSKATQPSTNHIDGNNSAAGRQLVSFPVMTSEIHQLQVQTETTSKLITC